MQRRKIMDDIKKINEELKLKIKKLEEEREKLLDEVDSLWAMLDEMTKSDVQSWSHLLNTLDGDVVTRTLMITKKKADA
tara:strand:+ start:2556 stop:2792 length:237 start_codon:yes stop_codon:yes gene_type:complete